MNDLANKRMLPLLVALCAIFLASTPCAAAPIDLPKDAEGWTVFMLSPDSRICYVSTDGNDGNASFYNAGDVAVGSDPFNPSGTITAFATYAAAYAQTRDGYPDWILLKRGDQFTFSIGSSIRSGRDSDEPFLIGAYGPSGGCPVVKTGSSQALSARNNRFFALSGIDFYAHTRNPDGPDYVDGSGSNGFRFVTGSGETITGVLFEGCKFRFYSNNSIQIWQGDFVGDIHIRRCLFADNYSESAHSQGLYTSGIDGITLEENIFIHNGWYMQSISGDNNQAGGQATMFNHNTYFSSSTNVTFKDNMFIEGASSGNKFTAAADVENLVLENNLYVGGEVGISMGGNYPDNDQRFNTITISNNVLTNIGMSRPTNRTLSWYFWFQGWNGGQVDNNYLLHQQLDVNGNTVAMLIQDDHRDVTFTNNIVFGLLDGIGLNINTNDVSGMVFSNNIIQIPTGSDDTIRANYATSGAWTFSGNTYFNDKSEGTRFSLENESKTFGQWQTETGDDSTFSQFVFPDATRDIPGYQAYIGEAATMEAFVVACRAQNRFGWDLRYTTDTVNDWLKAGFTESESDDDGNGNPNGDSGGSGCFISNIRGIGVSR
jgi:hypothetical protein